MNDEAHFLCHNPAAADMDNWTQFNAAYKAMTPLERLKYWALSDKQWERLKKK